MSKNDAEKGPQRTMERTGEEGSSWRKQKLDPMQNSPIAVLKMKTIGNSLYWMVWRQLLNVTSQGLPVRHMYKRGLEITDAREMKGR